MEQDWTSLQHCPQGPDLVLSSPVVRLYVKSLLRNISFPPLIMDTVMYYDDKFSVRPQSQQARSIIPTLRFPYKLLGP